jgi:hypothetical protein
VFYTIKTRFGGFSFGYPINSFVRPLRVLCGTIRVDHRTILTQGENKMGRPIKDKFFGSSTTPYQNASVGGRTGVGGESVTSVIAVASSGTLYSAGATLVVSASNIAGGIRATATPTISLPGIGGITAVTLGTAGTGYTATATITVTTASSVTKTTTGTISTNIIYPADTTGIQVGMKVVGTGINAGATYVTAVYSTGTVVSAANASTVSGAIVFFDAGSGFAAVTALTTTTFNAIQIISYISTGSSGISGGDIMKQEGSRRYLVQNAQGQGICKLSTGTLAAGQMHIIATDSAGDTYWVTKLTSRKANVYPRSNTGTSIYSTIRVAPWTIGSASGTTTGTAIISLSHTI